MQKQLSVFVGKTLKKTLSLTLALAMLLGMVVIGNVFVPKAYAADPIVDGDYTYIVLDDGTAQITKYTGSERNVTVPTTLGGADVSAVGKEAFDNNDVIEEVTFSEGIRTIGFAAFRNCDNLEAVNFSSTVNYIGQYAFEGCKGLQAIDIPSTVKTIDDRAFNGCPILKSFVLHEGLEKLGNRILVGTPVNDIYIPTTITTANEPFADASELYNVTFGEGITAIPNDMFEDNKSIRELTIPTTVTKLGGDSLCQMTALESIVIPDTVTEWGQYVLYQCPNLRSVTIGSGVTDIPSYAFSGCTNLTEITIPANIKTIGYGAFLDCSRLATVTLSEGLEDIGSYSFSKTALTEITIPATVTKGSFTFDNCTSLKTVNLSDGIPNLIKGMYQNTAVESVDIPEGITELPNYLFKGCKKLSHVGLPSTLKVIGEWCFENCTSLTSIDVPASVRKICTHAFYNTTSMTSCTLHEGVQTMDNRVFEGSKLTSIYIPKTLSTANAPFDSSNITDVTFADGITAIPSRLFCRAYKLTDITIPATVTKLGSDCFAYTNIEKMIIPDTVKTMERCVFYGCNNLCAVKIGAGIRTIPEQCFYECTMLQNVIVPETVTGMDSYAFAKSGVSYQKLPQSILNLSYGAFYECKNLVTVECSDKLESLQGPTFQGCVNLTTLKTSVQSIGFDNSTFENCPKFLDKRFYVFNQENTGIESTSNIGSDHTLVHFTVRYDIRDDWEDEDISMRNLYLSLPNNLEIVPNSFAAEGFAFDNATYTGDYKTFSLSGGNTTGELRFSAYLNNSSDELKDVSAQVEFNHKNVYFKKPIGNIRFTTAKLSLFAPSTATEDTVVVSGYTATPDKPVKVTISHLGSNGAADSSVSYTVTPNKYTGKYISDPLKIVGAGVTAVNEDRFEVSAECNGVKSDTVGFDYMPSAVRVVKAYETVNINRFISPRQTEQFVENNQSNRYDITGIFTRGTSPVIVVNPAKMYQFKIQLENDENICHMVLMSHKGNDWKFMELHYDAASDMWIGEGYFDINDHHLVAGQNYVPGALNLFYYYGERKDTYRSHYYGNGGNMAPTGGFPSIPGLDDDDEDIFYYDKDGKPHGKLGDYHETIGSTAKDIFKDIVTGDWKSVPADATVGGLKALWEWGNKDDNLFRATHHGISIGPDGLPVFPEDRADMYNRNADKDGKQRNAIDPSGVVYEAVESNPVEGATMSIEKYNEETGEWELWNAADFEQENPILTNSEGAYAWLTDEGSFRVTVSKEGYESQTSEAFDIPPEKLDLNFSLVDNTTHPVLAAEKGAQYGEYTVTFSKFMDPATVTTDTVTVEGLSNVSIVPQYLSEGDAYTDTFTVSGVPVGDQIKFSVTDNAKSYSGVSAEPSTETVVEDRLSALLGDVDGDGDVTILDATAIQRALAKLHPNPYIEAAADANDDKDISILDATEIQRWLAKLPANEHIGKPIAA